MRLLVTSLICILLAGAIQSCGSSPKADSMLPRTFVASSGKTLPYRIFIPEAPTPGDRQPLVIFLHGGTGSGTDNLSQITGSNERGAQVWIQPDNQARHPCFVLAPQIPEGWGWDSAAYSGLSVYAGAVVELLEKLKADFPIDEDRVYLTGQSLGGWGTWDLIAKRPGLFAAAVPVCGGGDPSAVVGLKDISVWAFHGSRDSQIPVERTREMVAALREAGAAVRYTEYKTLGHAVWNRAYTEGDLVDWLFAQRRTKRD